MDVRPYLPTDRQACLNIFDSNSFSPGARLQFAQFLDQAPTTYFVLEYQGELLGCGGYQVDPEPGLATLLWGVVRRESEKLGLDRFLLMYRLREIGKCAGIERVRVETPQESVAFFEHQGFKVTGVTGNQVEMVKRLIVCA